MSGRVDSERKTGDDGKSRITQCARKRLRIACALCCRIPAADHCERRTIQQLEPSNTIEKRRRIARLKQRFRIFRVIKRDERPARLVGPVQRSSYGLRNAFGMQSIQHIGREKAGQRAAPRRDDGLGKTKALQQLAQRRCAQPRR